MMPESKRILVTGSKGYIGKHLVDLLNQLAYDVYKADINDLDQPVDINHTLQTDIEFDAIVHLAALVNVGESVNRSADYYQTNIIGAINVLRTIPCDNFIFASTGSAEGLASPYSISKKVAEELIIDHCRKKAIDYTVFRFYNVIGTNGHAPTNPDGLFYNLIQAETTGKFNLNGTDYNTKDGTCVRDYIHVMEVCAAIVKAIEMPAKNIENLGHGRGWTVKEIVDIYQRVNNVEFEIIQQPRRSGDLEMSVLDAVSSYMEQKYTIEELLRRN